MSDRPLQPGEDPDMPKTQGIQAEVKPTFFTIKSEDHTFKCIINPTALTHKINIKYNPEPSVSPTGNPPGNSTDDKSNQQKYANHTPTELSFKLQLDGTISPKAKDSKTYGSVEKQIALLKQVCYNYDSEGHAPKTVLIQWGEMIFENASLTQLNINYTLFSKTGIPLRADLDLSFSVALDKTNVKKIIDSKSPDMSRIRVLNDDDKLSLMCAEFYGDSSKQLQVAKENGIINFRKLKPGTEVYFPPIKK
jgi:Contractile injection system tube protein